MPKIGLAATVKTFYDDLTNSANFTYTMVIATNTCIPSQMFYGRWFELLLPSQDATYPATGRSNVTLAPPAIADQSIVVSPLGIVTFVDAHEKLVSITYDVAITDMSDNIYDTPMLIITSMPAQGVPTVADGLGAVTVNLAGGYDVVFAITGDYVTVTDTLTVAQIALATLPTLVLLIGDKDLLTRQYDGRNIEMAIKAAIAAFQVIGFGAFEGVVAQLVNHISGSPVIGLDIPSIRHSVRLSNTVVM